MTSLVQQIDHIVIEAADEQAVFEWFTAALALPVAWPVAHWGDIHEGGVCVGDVNLGCNHALDPSSDPAPAIRAVALQPAGGFETVLPDLDRRGIACSDAFSSPDGMDLPEELLDLPWAKGWATSVVMPWRQGVPVAFFCLYNHDCRARRAQDVDRLRSANGGMLGIKRLREIVIESTDPVTDIDAWRRLLSPVPEPEPGLFSLESGPDLRVVSGGQDRFATLVFEVESRAGAAAGLDQLGIRYENKDLIHLEPADALGLDVRLAG